METYKKFEIVAVPFPFTDRQAEKRRPALVISDEEFNTTSGHAVMAMITSQKNPGWPLDVNVSGKGSGLTAPSKVRMKLFALDCRLIVRKIGQLSAKDQGAVEKNLAKLIHP
jgi:mRNA interferase MazF